jgi:hypothetical protein
MKRAKLFKDVLIRSPDDMPSVQLYKTRLQNLLAVMRGTMVGSRGFGINPDVLDLPPGDAADYLLVDLQEAADEYIRELDISGIKWTADINGGMNLALDIGASGEVPNQL